MKIIASLNEAATSRLEKYICFTINYLFEKKGITLLLFTEASYKNEAGLKQVMSTIYKSQKQYFAKIILDGIAEGIWDENINVDHLTSLYMGIPVTMNIETILHLETFNHNEFCKQMEYFILKVLAK